MNSKTPTCPLCRSTASAVTAEVSTKHIRSLYQKHFDIDVSHEFGDVARLEYRRCSDCDLEFFSPCIVGSERFYGELQNYSWYYLDNKPEYLMAQPFIKASDDVLEVGAGLGAFSQQINCRSYTGLEYNPKAVQQAQQSGRNVVAATMQSWSRSHPSSYDVVCSFQVLEHVSDLRPLLDSSVSAIRPGGLLLVCVPSSDSYIALCPNSVLNMPPHHVTRWSDVALHSLGTVLKLEMVAIEHEKLAEFHKVAYASALILRCLSQRFKRVALADLSFSLALAQRLSGVLGRLLASGLDDDRMLPRGHSVLAVYKKAEHSGAADITNSGRN